MLSSQGEEFAWKDEAMRLESTRNASSKYLLTTLRLFLGASMRHSQLNCSILGGT